ncbi:MAG: glutamate--tRNA ligase [Rickettsiaceae bacterium]|nr:glutamate--tRNA ligase [Rickettsiaceae bacterium]
MIVRTRFAPSPTGFLHIGGARTALFNYLFARAKGGKFLLRIEDTDRVRSNKEAEKSIISSLKWLDIEYDEEIIYQSQRAARHVEIAKQLIEAGKAYYCFATQEEIAVVRDAAIAKKEHFIFHSPWRDVDSSKYPAGQKPVIRIKAPREGEMVINDLLQGKVRMQNSHLDDMVLLRADGTPTYMLAVVVDDHDMSITHIIRGDDHLNNAFRQKMIYDAMDWQVPDMVHIPLIHGQDGAKLSKRHGALGADDYKKMGYLPEALSNYLLRLGWSHGDDEIISRKQAIEWFNLESLGKSPARLDFSKMRNINAHYLRASDNKRLAEMIYEYYPTLNSVSQRNILAAIDLMKPRAELMTDLYNMAPIFFAGENYLEDIEPAAEDIIKSTSKSLINSVINDLQNIANFNKESVRNILEILAKREGMKLGELMKYIRVYVTGRIAAPSIFEIAEIIGREEMIARLKK